MYVWLVFIHVAATFAFVLAHGVAASVAFALRRERDPQRIRVLLAFSAESYPVMYLALVALLVSGVVAGFAGSWWGEGWIWLSLLLLIALVVAMSVLGGNLYSAARRAAGLPYAVRGRPQPAEPPLSPDEIAAQLAQANPWLLLAVGYGGLLLIVWLMIFKPF